ncbi:unnamed protein product, partial [marine sediment metagenome]
MTTELDRKIYAYYKRRKALAKRKYVLDGWEEDRSFLGMALALYPEDCGLACFSNSKEGSKPSKARRDLSLRWQGHKMLADARALVESLADSAQQALVDLA